ARHQFADTADRILVLAHRFDEGDHLLRLLRIGTAHGSRLNLFQRDGGWIGDVGDDRPDLLHIADDTNALFAQDFLGDRPRRHAAQSLPRAGAAAAPVVADAVLGVEGEIGVAGAILVLDVGVIPAALVLIAE